MKEHNNHKERVVSLRNELSKTRVLGTFNNDLYEQQMTQLLNSFESKKQKLHDELSRIADSIATIRGQQRALDQASDQLIEIVAAYNRANVQALAAEKQALDEREEAARDAEPPANGNSTPMARATRRKRTPRKTK